MRKVLSKILGIILVMILLAQYTKVFATTETDALKQEQSEIDDQLEEAKQKQEELEAEKSEALKAVEDIIEQISDVEDEIDTLEAKITNLQAEIKAKEKDIEEKEQEYNEQEALLDARLIAIYESGETSYLDVLLTSSSITDFLSKYYLAAELVEYDKQLIQEIKDQKAALEAEKAELEANKQELDTALAQSEGKSTELTALKKSKETYVAQLTEEEKEVQEEIEELEAANKQIAAEIAAAEKKLAAQLAALQANASNSSNSTTTTGSGYFIRPVSSGTISATAYYSSGKFHGGIDYSVSTGTVVMAAADGVVMTTGNLSSSYGTYVVIRHANGLQTYYAHGTPGSITVSVGQTVSQGEKIMLSGNSGNSTGPHLHFEVRVSPYNYSYSAKAYGDDSRVNPLNYL